MGKQAQFKDRLAGCGKDVTLARFEGFPTGTYMDAHGRGADPDSATYPSVRPTATYYADETVTALVQPMDSGRSGTVKAQTVTTPWGEEVKVAYYLFVAGDQEANYRDKYTIDSEDYWVAAIYEHEVYAEVVYKKLSVVRGVPQVDQ